MTIWIPQPFQQDDSVPKYRALANAIESAIDTGQLQPGDKLPTHRFLADQLQVTVGTVTRGYAEAERRQLVTSKVGSGTFVREVDPKHQSFYVFDHVDEDVIDLSYSIALNVGQSQRLAETLSELSGNARLLQQMLNYHPEYGMHHHRQIGAGWLQERGFANVEADQILMTNGGQHGFFSALTTLTRSGDTVLAEGLSYPGYILSAAHLGLRLVGVDMDEQGLVPDALAVACQRHKPRVLYLMTRMSNPNSIVMSAERIDAIAAICRQHQVFIIEDDVQGCMADPNSPSFTERHPDISILVTSLSKMISGGLRVGYVKPPATLFNALGNALRTSHWMSPPLNAEIISQWITDGTAKDILAKQTHTLAEHHRLVAQRLQGFNIQHRSDGLNVWLPLPPPWRAQSFADEAEKQGVLVKTSDVFAAGHYAAPQAIRFCVGGAASVPRLNKALDVMLDLLGQSTPTNSFTI